MRQSWICFLLGTLCLASCSHYQLGDGSSGDPVRIHLDPVQTAAIVQRSGADLARQVRDTFANDPRIRLATAPDKADYRLALTVRSSAQDVVAGFSEDTGKPAAVRNTVVVEMELTPVGARSSAEPLRATIDGDLVVYARESGSFQESRLQSGARLQRDLAVRIRDRTLDLIP